MENRRCVRIDSRGIPKDILRDDVATLINGFIKSAPHDFPAFLTTWNSLHFSNLFTRLTREPYPQSQIFACLYDSALAWTHIKNPLVARIAAIFALYTLHYTSPSRQPIRITPVHKIVLDDLYDLLVEKELVQPAYAYQRLSKDDSWIIVALSDVELIDRKSGEPDLFGIPGLVYSQSSAAYTVAEREISSMFGVGVLLDSIKEYESLRESVLGNSQSSSSGDQLLASLGAICDKFEKNTRHREGLS
ncbi:hypothetical protein BJ742DRAFT_780792 [Cladochytrium replicatum]|nr:hypothetical protein BJ742DRAFT_780792 [Cladochytrium replicatum]